MINSSHQLQQKSVTETFVSKFPELMKYVKSIEDKINQTKLQMRNDLMDMGLLRQDYDLIEKYPDIEKHFTCSAIDGSCVTDHYESGDLIACCAVRLYNCDSPSIEDRDIYLSFVPHYSVNGNISTAIMFRAEVNLAANSNTDLVMLDGSLFTPIIALNFGISQGRHSKTQAIEQLENNIKNFFLDYKKILTDENKIYVACLKGTERKDISNLMSWDHECNELWLMDKVLQPGEYIQPSKLITLDKKNISYLYKGFNDIELIGMINDVEGLLQNNASFCYYKPDKCSRALRLEFPTHNAYDERKFATLLSGIKNNSCKNALIKEPELLYLADREAKEIHTAMKTLKMIMPSAHYRTESIFME